jgi:hypothetical protein
MYQYIIYDYHANHRVLVDSNFSKPTSHDNAVMAIIEVYPENQVIENLKEYYTLRRPWQREKIFDNDHELGRIKKYYPCLKRHLEKLKFIGK